MTDCDQCVHWCVCSCYNLRDRITQRYDYCCAEFKDCSEWLHLPCKVGDIVYKLWYVPCHLGETYPDSSGCIGCMDKCDIKKVITEYKVPNIEFIVNVLMHDSNVYFLTLEEAEKALRKQREMEKL